jgi:hypothetical protein
MNQYKSIGGSFNATVVGKDGFFTVEDCWGITMEGAVKSVAGMVWGIHGTDLLLPSQDEDKLGYVIFSANNDNVFILEYYTKNRGRQIHCTATKAGTDEKQYFFIDEIC